MCLTHPRSGRRVACAGTPSRPGTARTLQIRFGGYWYAVDELFLRRERCAEGDLIFRGQTHLLKLWILSSAPTDIPNDFILRSQHVQGRSGGDGGGGGYGAVLVQAPGGPFVELEPSIRAYAPNQAVAPSNITSAHVTELVSHLVMSALNAVAPQNIHPISVTELVSHPLMSALNDVAS